MYNDRNAKKLSEKNEGRRKILRKAKLESAIKQEASIKIMEQQA